MRSGIQEPDGGVARYYRSDVGKNALVSTEITGYSVSFLAYAYQCTGRQEYLDAAQRGARFLTRQAWNAELGLFPFELPPGEPLGYFFDSGIIVRGLLAMCRITQEQEFADIAVAAGHGMLKHFRSAAAIHPILLLPSCQPKSYEPRWSASPGCYQLKSAMAWHDLFELTGDRRFLEAYESELEQAIGTQEHFLPGDPDPERVMDRLHAYSYYLEGMLPRLNNCRAEIESGIQRLSRFLYEIAPRFARSDVYAQLLRVRMYAGMPPPAEEAQAIASFQFESGGFGFGVKRGETMPFVNPVSTAFCAQALDMRRRFCAGEPLPNCQVLV